MTKSRLVGRFLCTTMLSGAAVAMAAPAFAQDDEDQEDTIIVTGSRLNQANLSSSSPVFQVDAAEVDARGTTRIEDFINILPQAFAAQTSEVANGATGTSQVDLRNLGSIRTLVLLDGKRLPFGSAQTSSPNLDIIPAQLVERVDIVTGGASAVYGSDAMAGVVNFILRRDFEGIMFDGQVGFFQDGNNNEFASAVLNAGGLTGPDGIGGVTDGRDVLTTLTVGANTPDGRGNVTAFFSYQNQNEIRQEARDFSHCAFATRSGSQSVGNIGCVGSSTFRRFFNSGGATDVFQEADGTLVPFVGGVDQTFNFAPDNFIQRPNERFNITALSRYEITDDIEAYMDLSFTNNTTDAQIAFSGSFFRPFEVNCGNPFLGSGANSHFDLLGCPAAVAANGGDADNTDVSLTFGRRNVEGDPRNSFIETNTWRAVTGFRGTLGDNWNWDTYGTFARTRLLRISQGDLSFANVQEALFVVTDANGNPVCRDSGSPCVPWNVFQRNPDGSSLVTKDQTDFIQGTGLINGTTEQLVVGGTFSGDLADYGFKFPWAETGVQGLLGVEWRRDELDRIPDAISRIPGGRGLTGTGGATLPIDGEISVKEIFMETQIPIVEGKEFFEEFGLNGAYRFSDYKAESTSSATTNNFETSTFAVGVTWRPVPDVRLRGQFQRAVRAPNVIEMFTGQNTGLFSASARNNGLFDPCASAPGVPPSATAVQCAFTGVSAAQFGSIPDNPAGQLNLVTGGNPLLDPEKADTYTAGIVITPSQVPGLTLALDYFDIEIEDAISTIPAQQILDNCIATGDSQFCNLITRDRFGSLFLDNSNFEGIQVVNTNIANFKTRGLDINASYRRDVPEFGLGDMGSFSLNYAASVMFENTFESFPGSGEVECKGLYGGQCSSTPNNEYRHRALLTWQSPWEVDLTFTHRYFSSVDLEGAPSGNIIDDKLDSANYLDLAASWHAREGVEMRVGVQNVFGRDPELTQACGPAACNGNTIPGTYDAAGRFIFIGFNLRR
ncbi:MAG: TonB-dependent receptor domain-containing protein [Parvularculaceae bacterium]